MNSAVRIAGVICLLFMATFTGKKLVKMAQIRGFVSGGETVEKTITDKAILEGPHGPTPWISWDNQPIEQVGYHRINLPEAVWAKFAVGDTIQLIELPGEEKPYVREGIFASNGNFIFDFVLLGAWLTGIGFLAWPLFRRKRQGA